MLPYERSRLDDTSCVSLLAHMGPSTEPFWCIVMQVANATRVQDEEAIQKALTKARLSRLKLALMQVRVGAPS